MICVSIANESRRLAMADMLTAAHQGDLLEVRLDRFDKAPDFKELLVRPHFRARYRARDARDGLDYLVSFDAGKTWQTAGPPKRHAHVARRAREVYTTPCAARPVMKSLTVEMAE
jgi:hypothetical protein